MRWSDGRLSRSCSFHPITAFLSDQRPMPHRVFKNGLQFTYRGQCYDPNFRRFLPILPILRISVNAVIQSFGDFCRFSQKKIAVFLEHLCYESLFPS
jgi:hypothetical protein